MSIKNPQTLDELLEVCSLRDWSYSGARVFFASGCLIILFGAALSMIAHRIAFKMPKFARLYMYAAGPLVIGMGCLYLWGGYKGLSIWPALRSDYTNPNYPEQEFWFLFKKQFRHATVGWSIACMIFFLGLDALMYRYGATRGPWRSAFLFQTAIICIGIFAKQYAGTLNRDWDAYVATRDGYLESN